MSAVDVDRLRSDGFCFVRQVLDNRQVSCLIDAVGTVATTRESSRNARRLLETCPPVAELVESRVVRELVEPVLGAGAFVVRGLLFDKAEGANWHVGWHQDLMIPVAQRIETPGFTAWSTKEGVPHVRPPAEVLERMLTLRLHLDDSPEDNGPLMVLPGTHRQGMLDADQIMEEIERQEPIVCTAKAGDVLAMRPLLMHASQKAKLPDHRRVVHLEFAAETLPGELKWWCHS